MTSQPNPAPTLARISPAGFAALFSGEDAPPAPPRAPAGLWSAFASLLARSARTLIEPLRKGAPAHAFARRAT